ncbi:KATNB1-like protein 1 [Clupea harengus]|uniref:KATNB1-like protein 1 n=1 Tax=Clupea harengus TaxID=7950 RepID=A0A6P3VVB5_CLUHA|nr:KATNB1-like protein 1 [Clupea harengus]XP_031437389.1 KATNB1-like protein 1 [Clupea harengus]
MAAGHEGNDTEFHRLKQAVPHDRLMHQVHSGAKKNMREVDYLNKEEIDKDRFPVGRCVYKSNKVKRVVVCKRRSRLSVAGSGPCRRAPSAGWPCDMANKENELTCAGDVQAIHYNDNCGFPVNSAEASKMAGAGTKYSDFFTEVSKDHDAMTHALFGRNLKLNVALTLWRKSASELVAYLVRIQDMGVLVDCLPVLAKSLEEEQSCISIGCCVDLLPQVKTVLSSKYEEHLIVALHWVNSLIKRWWPDISANGRGLQQGCLCDGNIQVMKQQLQELWVEGSRLILVPGTTGEIAKVIDSHLSQLR